LHIALAALFCFAILTLWVAAWWPVTVFQVSVFALACMVCCRPADKAALRLTFPLVALAFAVVWGVMQWLAGISSYSVATRTAIVHWATMLAVFLAGCAAFRRPSALRWFRAAMLWFGLALSIQATLQSYTAPSRIFWLFPTDYVINEMGPVVYHNHYAAIMEVVLPIALYEALRPENRNLLWGAVPAAMYASVIASASRAGAILTTLEVLVAMGLLWRRGRASGRAVGLSLASIAAFCIVFTLTVSPETVWARFHEADTMRPQLAATSLRMIAAHPWAGVGLGAWPIVYPHYATVDFAVFVNQAHCDWLQWAAEGGVPFVLMMIGLFIWTVRAGFRSVWGLGAVSVFLHALVDYPFSRPALGSWVVVIIAMLWARETAAAEGSSCALKTPSRYHS
jgi:O-antigen ligase